MKTNGHDIGIIHIGRKLGWVLLFSSSSGGGCLNSQVTTPSTEGMELRR